MIHVLIVALGSRDLIDLARRSLHRYAHDVTTHVEELPATTNDPRAHGAAIDRWRDAMRDPDIMSWRGPIRDTDTVVIMDPDVAILSEWWLREMIRVLYDENPGDVGIWGAGSAEDFGPRVHASMMAIRGTLWNTSQATFLPIGTGPWRDTGGFYCEQAMKLGWKVVPVERGSDWNRFSAWWKIGSKYGDLANGIEERGPMWTHLGGGSHSDPTRMTWWQRIKRRRAVRERERFKAAVREHLHGNP